MTKLIWLVLFGLAFGFVEAAVVVYLRLLFGFNGGSLTPPGNVLFNLGLITFLTPETTVFPHSSISLIEPVREAATIIILVALACLSATKTKRRLGAFLVAWAIWDLSYYVFLRLLINWPQKLTDADVYFLLPFPWVGPVFTPILASILLLILGIFLLRP